MMRSVSSLYLFVSVVFGILSSNENNNKTEIINWVPAPSLHNCIDKSAREHYILQQPGPAASREKNQETSSPPHPGRLPGTV